ncbi:hypothetical protein FKW77_002709 [Venturia effusa]|uniref:Mid2 domain-containing protein n=1 Tax=Venturia effusa TaxID=50376 RepID=A0A517LF17_9PEZI|nr:hypothetical protein FKW77_002709 [Venturia effusa]
MPPATQQTNLVEIDTSIPVVPAGTLASNDLTGLPTSAAASTTPMSISSPSSTSTAKTASLLDAQAHGSGKNVGIAIGIAIAIIFLVATSTMLIFCSRKRKQAKEAQYSALSFAETIATQDVDKRIPKKETELTFYRKEARSMHRSRTEEAPPPYVPSKGDAYYNSMRKDELPATPTRPQGLVVSEPASALSNSPIHSVNSEVSLPEKVMAPPLRSETQPSLPMTHVTEGSWTTLPTMSTQPTLPKTYAPGRLAPLPNENMPSRFST